MDDALKAEEREKVERQRAENLKETLRNTSCADQQEKYDNQCHLSNQDTIGLCVCVCVCVICIHEYAIIVCQISVLNSEVFPIHTLV